MQSLMTDAVSDILNAGQAGYHAAVAQVIEWVPNCGIPVSQRSVMNIKLLVFWLKIQRRISRIPVIGEVSVALVRQWRDESVFKYDFEVTMNQPFIDEKDWPKTIEKISEFLAAPHGEQGNPFSL
jgi:hypothetical protein